VSCGGDKKVQTLFVPRPTGCHSLGFDHDDGIGFWVGALQGTVVLVQVIEGNENQLGFH
jgi:hypothetical protein